MWVKHGFSSLSNAELIAILIGSGNRTESAVELSRRMLSDFKNDLDLVGKASVDVLTKYNGMGEAKTINVLAALELGKRRQLLGKMKPNKINCSQDVFTIMAIDLDQLDHEEFWVVFLDRANNVINKARISMGGVSGTVIDVRIILKLAIEKLASSLILVHNHPSGNLSPSDADLTITKKMIEAAKLVDIKVLDHLIIAGSKFTSFADEGLIP
ncbi:MAG: DNA repair protein RadC [Prolixibacteraceae bacterium]|jgi:DNA repair protein RadC|nr:DNA repair protein RadC [Prolixibacteraceae bacterium]